MDVKRNWNYRRINDYIHWLDVALRAQVVCNISFSRKFNEIEHYILTDANGYLHMQGCNEVFRKKFERLVDRAACVSAKYNIVNINYLREHLRRSKSK